MATLPTAPGSRGPGSDLELRQKEWAKRAGSVVSSIVLAPIAHHIPGAACGVINARLAQPPFGELLDVGQWRFAPGCGGIFPIGDPVFLVYDLYNLPAALLAAPPPLRIALELDGQPIHPSKATLK